MSTELNDTDVHATRIACTTWNDKHEARPRPPVPCRRPAGQSKGLLQRDISHKFLASLPHRPCPDYATGIERAARAREAQAQAQPAASTTTRSACAVTVRKRAIDQERGRGRET